YIGTLDGLSVALGVILSLIVAVQIHKRKPMSRLIGICHVFFIPPVVILGLTLLEGTGSFIFKTWALYSFAVMGVGVLLDVGNVALYYFSNNKSLIKENRKWGAMRSNCVCVSQNKSFI
ncbi:MAG: hypothetical protein VB959_01880, partial [Rhodospirillales bacterium]